MQTNTKPQLPPVAIGPNRGCMKLETHWPDGRITHTSPLPGTLIENSLEVLRQEMPGIEMVATPAPCPKP